MRLRVEQAEAGRRTVFIPAAQDSGGFLLEPDSHGKNRKIPICVILHTRRRLNARLVQVLKKIEENCLAQPVSLADSRSSDGEPVRIGVPGATYLSLKHDASMPASNVFQLDFLALPLPSI